MHRKKTSGFTLIEMIVSVTLFAIIFIIGFDVLGNISLGRVKQASRIDIDQDLFYAVENLVSTIKDFGGDIDYEEYWNRTSVGTATSSGHYSAFSGYGNNGAFYYCRSKTSPMGTSGCLSDNNSKGIVPVPAAQEDNDYNANQQRYGEYSIQFIDYNSNHNDDMVAGQSRYGDEDQDGAIQGDDDDENQGQGPSAFSGSSDMAELYLIKKGKTTERVFFRLNYKPDPDSPTHGSDCDMSTGSGCLGNIQMLRLIGKDYGNIDHQPGTGDEGEYDGVIDSWLCSPGFKCNSVLPGIGSLASGVDEGWIDILPDYVNVKSVRFFLFPSKDYRMAWKDTQDSTMINPMLRLNLILGYSWAKKKFTHGADPSINVMTSINLIRN